MRNFDKAFVEDVLRTLRKVQQLSGYFNKLVAVKPPSQSPAR